MDGLSSHIIHNIKKYTAQNQMELCEVKKRTNGLESVFSTNEITKYALILDLFSIIFLVAMVTRCIHSWR